MDQRILEFIGDLRRAEIRISPSEALDALAASAEVGLSDRETFKATLAATLIKEFRDHPTFDRLFNLYFLDLEALGEGLKKAIGPRSGGHNAGLERLMYFLQVGFFSRRPSANFHWSAIEGDLERIMKAL